MEIHQLIFVDDESIVREGVQTRVAWGKNGFNLAGVFENGLDAYRYIEENSVDVVISDINMPKMDGLELSRLLSENYPGITIILLTGYDEFEYAQKAVKNKVRDFLLKPVTAEELESILGKLHIELSRKKENEKQYAAILEKLELSFPLLRERFFTRLVSGKLEDDSITKRKDFFQWEDREGLYQIINIRLEENCEEVSLFLLIDYCTEIKTEYDEVFSDGDGSIVILLQDIGADRIITRSRDMAEKTFLHAESLSLLHLYIGLGDHVDAVCNIQQSYREARSAADYAKILGFSQIVFAGEIMGREKVSLFRFQTLENKFKKQLKEGSRESALESFREIIDFIKIHYVSRDEISYYFTRIHTLLNNFIVEMDLFSSEEESPPPLSVFTSITSAVQYFSDMIVSIEDRIQEHRNSMVLSRIERAKDIIQKRYGDKNFSLQSICSELFISTSQFSVIFKEGTGQTFVEYLTSIRVSEAKKLLKSSDMRSYEIAEAVGFSDPGYFSIIFKKMTGLTPMEYRRNLEE